MNIRSVTAVYFSPTHGTRTYVEAIAGQLSVSYQTIDLTRPDIRRREYTFSREDLVIFGAPVYAGRLPVIKGGIFDRIHGDHTPAVFTVSYGNRAFEDALLEEKDICESSGFTGIAAAAWIAPHSFSGLAGAGRPDQADQDKIREFASRIQELLKQSEIPAGLQVPGNHPYRSATPISFHPEGNEACTHCGACTLICPTQAIVPDAPDKTDPDRCIACLACTRACPSHARQVSHPRFLAIVQRLESGLLEPREAELFF